MPSTSAPIPIVCLPAALSPITIQQALALPASGPTPTAQQAYDTNQDKQLNREEFAEFILKLTAETLTVVSRNMIVVVVATPMIALMTKRAIEGMLGVGQVVQRILNSIYATIITLGVVLLQNSGKVE